MYCRRTTCVMNIRTIKVNIRWYKEVISLRGDFFVCKSRKSFINKGVLGFFSFCAVFNAVPENLLVSHCCFVLAFIVRYFETSSYLGGFTQNIKSCTGSRLYNTSSKLFFNCTPYIYMQQSRHQNGPWLFCFLEQLLWIQFFAEEVLMKWKRKTTVSRHWKNTK